MFDYETIIKRSAWDEWPNLKERIHEPKIQASIQAFMDAFDHYSKKWKTYRKTGEDEGLNYAEWCGHMAENQLSILVDEGRVVHKTLDPYPVWLRKKKYQEKLDAIVPLDKLLPDDVLDIIRQYAKPAFIHFREYNQALDLFNLTLSYKQKLKERIVVPVVREQLKICVDAHDDYHKIHAVYLHHKTQLNEELSDKSRYWADVSKDKFVSLLDQREYRTPGYAAWYFHDDIEDAWMTDIDDEMAEEEDLRQQECSTMRKMKKETLMMEGEDRRGLNDIYDGLDCLYTVAAV